MAGLLDFLNTPDGQLGLGLLAAAGPRSDGAGFGQRITEGFGYAQKQQEAAMKQKMFQAQMEEYQNKIAREKQMRELAARFQTPAQPGLAPLQGDPSSGILPSAGMPAKPAGYDYQGYAGAVAGIDPMKALSIQQALRKDNQINKLDPKDYTPQSIAKFSMTKNYADLQPRDKLHFGDAGNAIKGINEYTGQEVSSIGKGQSPDNMASTGVTMRGQNMTDARARERLNVDNLTMGKAPSGYGWGPAGADGQPTLVALKGGPADMKQVGMLTQDTSMLNNGISSMDRLAAAANEILQHPGVAGISGLRGAIPNIPGTDAANAAALMQTMKSQVAFGVLQDMRNNSKTGGALGQVSDKEIGFLQSNLAALDKSQSVEQLRKNLQKIIDYSSDAKDRLMGAYNIKHGDNIQSAPDKPAANLMQSLPIANASNRGRKIRDTATGKTLVSNGMSWVEQ